MSDEVAVATPSQTVGPFFHFALTAKPIGRMTDRFSGGEPIRLRFRVTDGDGQLVTDAIVELWQTDGASSVFGRLPTGEDGTCEFETVRPMVVPADPTDGTHQVRERIHFYQAAMRKRRGGVVGGMPSREHQSNGEPAGRKAAEPYGPTACDSGIQSPSEPPLPFVPRNAGRCCR